MLRLLALATLCVCLAFRTAAAQQTRAELLERQRAERAQSLEPYTPNTLEKALLYLDDKRVVERLGSGLTGLYPRFGGFTTGSGITFGVGYRYALPGTKHWELDASTAFSMRGYKSVDLHVRAPALLRGRLEVDGAARWWDYTQEDYFGLGESSVDERTNYRYLGDAVTGIGRYRLHRLFSVGEEVGYLRPRIKEGTDERFLSTEQLFTDAEAPGLTRQPHLFYTRTFLDFDYRDYPGNTRSGGRVLFQAGTGRDQDPSREFSYRRADLEVLHVFPIFDKKRNFAVHFAASHVDPVNEDGRVPFFLSPTIGGANTIRSYLDLRFRDATFVLTNFEYRWEAFSGLDMALFWDGGDVGRTLRDIRAREYKQGWGFGLRFNTDRRVFLRMDFGFGGPEGTRFFWKYNPAF
jgi:outer membrane protein assembly factor BamA